MSKSTEMTDVTKERITHDPASHPWIFIGWILMLGYVFRTGAYRREYQLPRTLADRRKHEQGTGSVQRKGEDTHRKEEVPHLYDKVTLPNLWQLFKQAFTRWNEDHAQQQGAALAYYAVFSLAPLLMIVIAIAGLVFGQEAAEGQIMEQIQGLVGEKSAQAIQSMIEEARKPAAGVIATVLAIVMLLFGATGVFAQLQESLNIIWRVEEKPGEGIWKMIKNRFISLLAVLGTGFLLLISLVISAGLSAMGNSLGHVLPFPEFLLQGINVFISFAVVTLLFAMIYKLLPDKSIQWSDVWIGAIITSVLFTIGKFLIGLYLGKSNIGIAYGTAGALVVILIWVYYASQIFLFGAEFTAVYTDSCGSRCARSTHTGMQPMAKLSSAQE
jgi:membrane protein